MTKRKAISKKVRFEVFKRDYFSCQYCGQTPPSVVLEIDHINPAAKGGSNIIDNLITACFDCNRGKGVRLLESIPVSLVDKAAILAEKEAQLKGYQEILEQRRIRIEQDIYAVVERYEDLVPGYTMTEQSLLSVKRFVEALGVHAVIENLEIAFIDRRVRNQFKYFCGICWRQIRGE